MAHSQDSRSGNGTNANPAGDKKRNGCCIVGIGAGEGSAEGLAELFSPIPADSGMAFILIRSQEAGKENPLPDIPELRTAIPIRVVEDGMAIESNVIYVVPPNAELTVRENTLRISSFVEPRDRRTPIDLLFGSLADHQQDNVAGILMSGNGSDGTLGIKRIKEKGGMVLVQDPKSAPADSMIQSAVQTGQVDFVLEPKMMWEKLRLFKEARHELRFDNTGTLHDEIIDQIKLITLALQRTVGHDFSAYKHSTLSRRVQRRMRLLNLESAEEYVRYLQRNKSEVESLFHDLLISVTHFFRDPEAFRKLAIEVIPGLVKMQANDTDEIRIWVPGCATGEEAYTIAMLFLDYVERHSIERTIRVFATDIDINALDFARRGSYPEGIAEQIPENFLKRFFIHEGHHYRVSKQLRDLLVFSPHNLLKDPPFSRISLISCRNLLIYLEQKEQKRVLNMLHYALVKDGVLFLGTSENVGGPTSLFKTIDKKYRLFRKKEAVIGPGSRPLALLSLKRDSYNIGTHFPASKPKDPLNARQLVERIVLGEYAPAYAVVNERYEVIYSSGKIDGYLTLPEGNISTNILDMVRKGMRIDLRTALHEATRTRKESRKYSFRSDREDGHRIEIVVRPMPELGESEQILIVLFHDLPTPKEQPLPEHGVGDDHPVILQLEEELITTREQLQTTIEELETINEELQTSKEEIQSINEELYTVNGELNEKIREVNRANSDLQNLLQNTRIPTVFVGNDGMIKRFTREARELLRIIESDIGRPIGDVKTRFPNPNLEEHIARVVENLQPLEVQVEQFETGHQYLMRILPYRRVDNVIDGAVITFTDITSVLQAEQGERYIAAMLEYVPEGILLIDAENLDIRMISRYGRKMFKRAFDNLDIKTLPSFSAVNPQGLLDKDRNPISSIEDFPIVQAIRTGNVVLNEKLYIKGIHEDSVPILCTAAPIKNAEREIIAGVATWRDISQLEAAEQALHESEQNYRRIAGELEAIYRYAPIGLSVLDREGCYVRVNEHLAKLHGMPIEEHIGKDPFKLFPDLKKGVKPVVENVLKTGKPVLDIELEPFDPRASSPEEARTIYWQASYYPLKNESGEVEYLICVIQDVTRRRLIEETLITNQKELATLNADLESRVEQRTEQVRTLSAALAMAEQSERRHLSFILHDDLQQILFGSEMNLQILLDLFGKERSDSPTRDGKSHDGELQEGKTKGRKKQEKEVSDGRTPDKKIMGGISPDGKTSSTRFAPAIRKQIEGVKQMIERAINVTRTLSVELNPPVEHDTSLDTALRWLSGHVKDRYQMEVALDIEEDLQLPGSDQRTLMVQMVREILFNTIKHAGVKSAQVAAKLDGEVVVIRVSDEGKGFNVNAVKSREQPGLGLFSLEERVRLIGGKVTIDSRPGKGTSVTILFPRGDTKNPPDGEEKSRT